MTGLDPLRVRFSGDEFHGTVAADGVGSFSLEGSRVP